MSIEREERKSTKILANQKKEENFCLTYDSDQEISKHMKVLQEFKTKFSNRRQD